MKYIILILIALINVGCTTHQMVMDSYQMVMDSYNEGGINKAYAVSDNNIHGAAWNAPNEANAKSEALRLCKDTGGINCKIIIVNKIANKDSIKTQSTNKTRLHMIDEYTVRTETDQKISVVHPPSGSWVRLIDGSDIKYDSSYAHNDFEMKLNNGMLLRQSHWNEYLKEYIESFPLTSRNTILQGVTRYYTEYDKFDRVIKYEPLRYLSGPYSRNSYISLRGTLGLNATGKLKFYYYGDDWIFCERVRIVADDYSWESPKLKFYRDNSTDVWEYAYVDIKDPSISTLIENIVSSDEAIIRFVGDHYYSDQKISERMKKDLNAMYSAIQTINQ